MHYYFFPSISRYEPWKSFFFSSIQLSFFACLLQHEFVVNICRSERNFFCLGQWCVFHDGEGQSVGRIGLSSSSAKCKEICSIGRSKNLKYKNVTLQEHIGGLEGYHMTCYRRLTAFSKEYTKAHTDQTSASYIYHKISV